MTFAITTTDVETPQAFPTQISPQVKDGRECSPRSRTPSLRRYRNRAVAGQIRPEKQCSSATEQGIARQDQDFVRAAVCHERVTLRWTRLESRQIPPYEDAAGKSVPSALFMLPG